MQDNSIRLIEIGDVLMPAPLTYEIPLDDLDSSDSSVSESGVQIRNRVREFVRKINLSWRVGGADATTVLLASKPDKPRFFSHIGAAGMYITFPQPC